MRPRLERQINSRGQVAVEYVLLLLVAVSVAAVMVRTTINRDPTEPGFLIDKWNQLIWTISLDDAAEIPPPKQ